MNVPAPFAFLLVVIGGWVSVRTFILMPLQQQPAEQVALSFPVTEQGVQLSGAGERLIVQRLSREDRVAEISLRQIGRVSSAVVRDDRGQPARLVTGALPVEAQSVGGLVRDAAPPVALPPTAATGGSRWSGQFYLFRRAGGGRALAVGGQLGGSQAAGRITYRLNRDGPARLALTARLSTPLADQRGAEAALGLDWHPVPVAPLRLSIERRADIGGSGRDAWSAYAAGGFYAGNLPGDLEADGYAQAGMVGARSHDMFADGAVRLGKRITLGESRALVLGAGAWGAAQPGLGRLDMGPRASLSLPLAGRTATAAIDWRMRLAGGARPGSGLALTVSADF